MFSLRYIPVFVNIKDDTEPKIKLQTLVHIFTKY